jgi:GT2 family glycosyltransferase
VKSVRTLVILVNRNNRDDTIECLESLRRCEGDFDVFVSDNASTDGSIEAFVQWAEGKVAVDTTSKPWDAIRDHPIEVKQVSFGVYGSEADAKADPRPRWLTVASTGGSRGFAVGNNVGMRYGLERDYDYFWILNNDTVVEPTALVRLVSRMQSDPEIGVCGSTLVFYARPDIVQAWGGGRYHPHLAGSDTRGFGESFPPAPSTEALGEPEIIVGAAMFCSRAFLERIGLMNEDLYLYFEEIDWALRMRPQFKNGYEPQSIVYHKHGGTMGKDQKGEGYQRPSRHRIYYMTLNRILFTRKHFPGSLPTVALMILMQAAKNALRGRFAISGWILKDLVYGLTTARYPLREIP